jgi:hypothetical protein
MHHPEPGLKESELMVHFGIRESQARASGVSTSAGPEHFLNLPGIDCTCSESSEKKIRAYDIHCFTPPEPLYGDIKKLRLQELGSYPNLIQIRR